ncbi:MAG TPA: STAS domain-containing protein [Gemmataceae bacterium]|jgi:anti-anti-sigma regulatory factor|nr:STAS domain-containing protein [Gemmataceae bacterium]
MNSDDSTMTSVRLVRSKKGPRLVLHGNVSAGSAERLHQTALEAVALGTDVTADLAAVEELDASALQILIALRRTLGTRGRELRLAGASSPLNESLRLAGLLES